MSVASQSSHLTSSPGLPDRLCQLLGDAVPEVRAAAAHALGLFMGGHGAQNPQQQQQQQQQPDAVGAPAHDGGATSDRQTIELRIGRKLAKVTALLLSLSADLCVCLCSLKLLVDASPMVRREVVLAMSELVYHQRVTVELADLLLLS